MNESWSYSHAHARNKRRICEFGVDNISRGRDLESREPIEASRCARLDYEDDGLQRRYFIDLSEMHIA